MLHSIPTEGHREAKRLLDYLKRDGNLHYKHDGQVTYKNEMFAEFNTVNLLDTALRKKLERIQRACMNLAKL